MFPIQPMFGITKQQIEVARRVCIEPDGNHLIVCNVSPIELTSKRAGRLKGVDTAMAVRTHPVASSSGKQEFKLYFDKNGEPLGKTATSMRLIAPLMPPTARLEVVV
jgi:hypothetical protein